MHAHAQAAVDALGRPDQLQAEAELVRLIFRRFLDLGSASC